MNLHDWTIDIGNSRTKWAAFSGEQMVQAGTWEDETSASILAALTNLPPRAIILSTVAGALAPALEEEMRKRAPLLLLDEKTPLPFDNAYRTPATLGKDRLAAVAGAQAHYPGQHCLVIDAGTCITADFLEGGRVYRGGNISPGVRMRLQAMHTFTARLPLVESVSVNPAHLLGDSTETALRNGAVWGAVLELEGLYRRLAQAYGAVQVVLTGGDSALLASLWSEKTGGESEDTGEQRLATTSEKTGSGAAGPGNAATYSIFVQPNLVLDGLKQILRYNV